MKTYASSRSQAATGESRAAQRVVDVLDLLFRARDGLTLTQVAASLNIPKSSAHGILQALRRRGYLAWEPQTKAYSIGLRIYAAAHAAPVAPTMRHRARPHLERLARGLEETTILCCLDSEGGWVRGIVCLDQVESPSPVRYTVEVGARWPLHCTTLGKLYLATLGDRQAAMDLLHRSALESFTPQTPTTVDAVLEDLAEIRRDGFAVNREELVEGVTGYGMPVHVDGDVLVAGIVVLGPSDRIRTKGRAIVEELTAAAHQLSAELDQ